MTKEEEEALKLKVLEHGFAFKTLSEGQKRIADSIDALASNMKEILNDKIEALNENIHESFQRVRARGDDFDKELDKIKESRNTTGCPALGMSNKDIRVLNKAVFGKDGRGGLVYDIADIKKFIYRVGGFLTAINLTIGYLIAIYA